MQVKRYTPRQRGRLAIRPGITGWAQVNGRASLPWSERIELDLYYIEHRSLALDLRILWRTPAMVLGGEGLYKGETGGLEGDLGMAERRSQPETDIATGKGHRMAESPAILLTGVGKRYDIVACFAQLTTTIAVDPNPLAPAQYAAQVRARSPPIADPGYVPALQELCERHGVGAVIPLTDLDIEVLALARGNQTPPALPALVPSPEVARATYDKYEAHLLLSRPGAAIAADGAARGGARVLPGDGQATPWLGRALDPPRARPRREGLLRALRRRWAPRV